MNKKRIPRQFLGAFKKGHRFAAREYIDEEYSATLLEQALSGDLEALKALEFITKFNNEYYKGVFKKDGTDFHATKEERNAKECDHYAMKMDVLVKQHESLEVIDFLVGEDELVHLIDLKIEMEKSKKQ